MSLTEEAIRLSAHAIKAAQQSGCLRSRRGVVLWRPGEKHIRIGYNKPVLGSCDGSDSCKRICGRNCIHAEQMALLDVVAGVSNAWCEMLHVKVDAEGRAVPSGPPSCPECSKLILYTGVAGMWLFHEEGWRRYTAQAFHEATMQQVQK